MIEYGERAPYVDQSDPTRAFKPFNLLDLVADNSDIQSLPGCVRFPNRTIVFQQMHGTSRGEDVARWVDICLGVVLWARERTASKVRSFCLEEGVKRSDTIEQCLRQTVALSRSQVHRRPC